VDGRLTNAGGNHIFHSLSSPQKCDEVVLEAFQSVCEEHTYVKDIYGLAVLISIE